MPVCSNTQLGDSLGKSFAGLCVREITGGVDQEGEAVESTLFSHVRSTAAARRPRFFVPSFDSLSSWQQVVVTENQCCQWHRPAAEKKGGGREHSVARQF